MTACRMLAMAFLLSGCVTEEYGRVAARGGVRGLYEGADEVPVALRHKVLLALVTDEALRRAAHDLARDAVAGAAEGLSQADLDQKAAALVDATLGTLRRQGDATVAQLLRDAEPELEQVLRAAVGHTLLGTQATLRDGVRGAVQTFFDTAAQSVDRLAGPVGQFTSATLVPAAGQVARTAGREAVAGALEGLEGQQGLQPGGSLHTLAHDVGVGLGDGIGESFRGQLASKTETALIAVASVLSCLLLVLLGAFALLWRSYHASSKALAIISEKINAAQPDHQEVVRDLKRAIREGTSRNGVEGWLSTFLKARGR